MVKLNTVLGTRMLLGRRRSMLTHAWRKSSRSGPNGACVEARLAEAAVEIRDTKLTVSPVLRASRADWRSLLRTSGR
jgi:hypothetical protein